MNAKQRDRHERKMYLKGLRYGARYEIITTPAIRELIVNKKKYADSRFGACAAPKDTVCTWVVKGGKVNDTKTSEMVG